MIIQSFSWRDIVTMWWAWQRPWAPEWVRDEEVKELGVGETLSRQSHKVVRDLMWSEPTWYPELAEQGRNHIAAGFGACGEIISLLKPPYQTKNRPMLERALNEAPQPILTGLDATRFFEISFNHTVLAHITRGQTNVGFTCILTLVRFEGRKTIASLPLPSCDVPTNLRISRFNVFVAWDEEVMVFDLKGNFLYSIHVDDDPWTDWFACDSFNLNFHYRSQIDGQLFLQNYERPSGSTKDEFVLMDPKTRTARRVVKDFPAQLFEEGREEPLGYYFAVNEYPVDEAGKRTRAPGGSRVFWRWMERVDTVVEGADAVFEGAGAVVEGVGKPPDEVVESSKA
ncbi:hypothetical protein HDV00_007886 [Rhizophlyctis rosea]|nr:hypothetical protein HDV00_007886 [Rhizophlyctis rosea]